jgi:hypothetical protein
MKLQHELVDLTDGAHLFSDTRERGSYNRRRFILSLSEKVHEILELSGADDSPGEIYLSVATDEKAQAFSTYLHETIHNAEAWIMPHGLDGW